MAKPDKQAVVVPAGVSFAAELAFEDIHHVYPDGNETLHGITLSAAPGEVLCLLGPSGSGKTTLLRIAAGIEPQTSGRVLFNGREIAGPSIFLPPEKRSIGLVFQDFALFPHLTILENVCFGLTALTRPEAEREAMIALSRVGLTDYASAYPHVLSGGEQQRVALARAIAPRPAVLLMDEPFSGLDSRLKDTVRAETLAILRQSRATSVIVTHDAEEAMRLGDRIALLRNGELVQVGTGFELYRRPRDLFVAGFFSELNTLDATVRDGHADTPLGRFDAGGLPDGSKATVAIRLAGIEVATAGGGISARVRSQRFLGVVEMVELLVEGVERPLWARMRCGTLPADSTEICLSIRRSDVLVFETARESA
ncbi:MAG: ABC transporter ATP-binding protein [Rhizobiaceae bacterium]